MYDRFVFAEGRRKGKVKARYLIGVAVTGALTAAATLPPVASASPYHRHCGKTGDGGVLGSTKHIESAPYGIRMSPGAAAAIARRIPPGEFGSHEKASQVPCFVATAVALSAGNAWLHWPSDSGSVRVVAATYGGNVNLGVYRCTGRPDNQTVHEPGVTYHFTVRETCTHSRGSAKITGSFRIGNYSN